MFRMVLLALLLALPLFGENDNFSLHILTNKSGYITAQPFTSPRLGFKVLGGNPKGYVYGCQQSVDVHERAEHNDTVIVIKCADSVKLELAEVWLQ